MICETLCDFRAVSANHFYLNGFRTIRHVTATGIFFFLTLNTVLHSIFSTFLFFFAYMLHLALLFDLPFAMHIQYDSEKLLLFPTDNYIFKTNFCSMGNFTLLMLH